MMHSLPFFVSTSCVFTLFCLDLFVSCLQARELIIRGGSAAVKRLGDAARQLSEKEAKLHRLSDDLVKAVGDEAFLATALAYAAHEGLNREQILEALPVGGGLPGVAAGLPGFSSADAAGRGGVDFHRAWAEFRAQSTKRFRDRIADLESIDQVRGELIRRDKRALPQIWSPARKRNRTKQGCFVFCSSSLSHSPMLSSPIVPRSHSSSTYDPIRFFFFLLRTECSQKWRGDVPCVRIRR